MNEKYLPRSSCGGDLRRSLSRGSAVTCCGRFAAHPNNSANATFTALRKLSNETNVMQSSSVASAMTRNTRGSRPKLTRQSSPLDFFAFSTKIIVCSPDDPIYKVSFPLATNPRADRTKAGRRSTRPVLRSTHANIDSP